MWANEALLRKSDIYMWNDSVNDFRDWNIYCEPFIDVCICAYILNYWEIWTANPLYKLTAFPEKKYNMHQYTMHIEYWCLRTQCSQRNGLVWPSGEGQGFTVLWREFNPKTFRSCITKGLNLQNKPVSITADAARIHPYPIR